MFCSSYRNRTMKTCENVKYSKLRLKILRKSKQIFFLLIVDQIESYLILVCEIIIYDLNIAVRSALKGLLKPFDILLISECPKKS